MAESTNYQAKARENRLRRMALRQGYRLTKARTRDPHALDFGKWWIIELFPNKASHGQAKNRLAHDADEVERWLTSDERT